jgi:hypothetical protein
MAPKFNSALTRRGSPNIKANSPQIIDNLLFFILASTKQPQDTAWKLLNYSPPKRQPQPSIAWMAKH